MRKLILIFSLSLFFAGAIAHANDSKAGSNPCMMKDHGGMKHQMMEEGMGILLETIMLLKEVAKDDASKKKAALLEKRWRAHMEKHEKMHQMKHGKGHGMDNPCNPCSKGMHK